MKKKKLKINSVDLSKQITEVMTKCLNDRESEKCCAKKSDSYNYKWCDYDSEVSGRFKKLVISLLNYPDNLDIELSDYLIRIRSNDIKLVKAPVPNYTNSTSSSMKKSHYEEDLIIEIDKIGFVIYYNNKKASRYKDENIYNELFNVVKEKLKQINVDNFNDIWETISKESGILRDSNLDELLN